jgi:hypothetical protein
MFSAAHNMMNFPEHGGGCRKLLNGRCGDELLTWTPGVTHTYSIDIKDCQLVVVPRPPNTLAHTNTICFAVVVLSEAAIS